MTMHVIADPKAAFVDPLLVAIKAYRDGLAAYDAVEEQNLPEDGDDDLFAATIEGPHDVLAKWRSPATSHDAALAAISLAEREKQISGGSLVADAMEAAAIGYWKTAGRSKSEPTAAVEAPARFSLDNLSPDTLLRAPEVAAYLRVSESTLARWRCVKRGPVYGKTGGNVVYNVSDLLDYVTKSERKGSRPEK